MVCDFYVGERMQPTSGEGDEQHDDEVANKMLGYSLLYITGRIALGYDNDDLPCKGKESKFNPTLLSSSCKQP